MSSTSPYLILSLSQLEALDNLSDCTRSYLEALDSGKDWLTNIRYNLYEAAVAECERQHIHSKQIQQVISDTTARAHRKPQAFERSV